MNKKLKITTAALAICALLGFAGPKAGALEAENTNIIEESGAAMVIADGDTKVKLEDEKQAKYNYEFKGNFNPVEGAGNCRFFMGLSSWDCGLNDHSWEEDNLKGTILIIISNVTTDITIIAAYLVLAFVIYGGYRYLLAGGDAGNVAAGKRILVHAFIGLAIVMLSNLIFNAIRFGLLGGSTADTRSVGGVDVTVGTSDGGKIFASSFAWIVGIAGVAALVFIVYGAITYITSNGDPGKIKKAKETIMYAAIGLLIVALAEAITAFITSKINEAKNGAANPSSSIERVISLEEINHEETC